MFSTSLTLSVDNSSLFSSEGTMSSITICSFSSNLYLGSSGYSSKFEIPNIFKKLVVTLYVVGLPGASNLPASSIKLYSNNL